jgi:hypothetical protein
MPYGDLRHSPTLALGIVRQLTRARRAVRKALNHVTRDPQPSTLNPVPSTLNPPKGPPCTPQYYQRGNPVGLYVGANAATRHLRDTGVPRS